MKISKLFHWLYGFLMLLPIIAVGVKCGYVIFNKNANDSYLGTYNYIANSSLFTYLNTSNSNEIILNTINEVTTSKLTNFNLGGEIYSVNFNSVNFYSLPTNSPIIFNVNNLIITNRTNNAESSYSSIKSIALTRVSGDIILDLFKYNYDFQNWYYDYSSHSYKDTLGNTVYSRSNSIALYHNSVLAMNYYINFNNSENNIYYQSAYGLLSLFEKSIFYTDSTLSSVFYSALDELDSSPLINWSNNSFLSTPILYITNLFNMPSNHVAITLMSYWLNISIIWLVFDLIMYVPLLVHRWLDKGVLE